MAIDFPASPTVGQQYIYGGVTYTYTAQGVWSTTSAGLGLNVVTRYWLASTTFTPTFGAQITIVECLAGGGGSGAMPGAAASGTSGAPGGGAGSRSITRLTAAQVGVSQSIVIGAKGVGGVGGGNNPGTDGGNTSFGTFCTTNGGKGGPVGIIGAAGNGAANGGAGGAPGTGDFTVAGQDGGSTLVAAPATGANVGGFGGYGGSTPYGAGGAQRGTQNGITFTGFPAKGYGSGAGGGAGMNGGSNQPGVDGAPGLVITTEYIAAPIAAGANIPTVAAVGSVRGLVGQTLTGTTANGTYREAVLLNSTGDSIRLTNKTWSLDITLAGPVANGRDTSAALANGDVSFYAIWGASTPTNSVIASNANPDVGPALPSGYTHWTYLTTVKLTSGAMPVCYLRGNRVNYPDFGTIISAANSSAWAPYSTVAFVPAIATNIAVFASATATTSAGGAGGLIYYIGVVSGKMALLTRVDASFGGMTVSGNVSGILPNVAQTVWYQHAAIYGGANFSASAFSIYCTGYEVPNGS